MSNQKTISRDESAETIRHSFSKVAWFYDFWGKLTESKAQDKVWEYAGIRNGDTVLEVAVGTGLLFKKIVEINKEGYSTGVDLSPDMIAQAKKSLQGISDNNNYTLKIESADQLSCETGSIDVLINNYMFDLLPEYMFTPILNEFHRVLKPKGKLVITCMAFGNKWYHKFWKSLAVQFPAMLTFCRPVELSDYLVKAGFKIDKHSFISQNTFPSEVFLARKKL
jgi:ubiquinone/menaquinone biosynthesis C-methylase UbiE